MGNYGIHVQKAPNGTYYFVGSLPHDIAYIMPDGSEPTCQYVSDQLRLPSNYRKIKTKCYNSKEEAIKDAESKGYHVIMD